MLGALNFMFLFVPQWLRTLGWLILLGLSFCVPLVYYFIFISMKVWYLLKYIYVH